MFTLVLLFWQFAESPYDMINSSINYVNTTTTTNNNTNGSPNLGQKTRPYNNQQKKRNLQNCWLCFSGWPQNKTEKSEKKDKYLDLARELKNLWNMKVTIIPNVIGAFGTVTKGLIKRLEDLEIGRQMKTIQTTTLLRKARILRRVLETWWDLLSFKLQWNTIS